MSLTTTELINELISETDINAFFDRHEGDFLTIETSDFLNDLIAQKGMKVGDVARYSGQGDYVYIVFNGNRKPSRNILIAISVGMHLSLDETQLLLRVSKYATLDPRDKRDSIIIYGIKSDLRIAKLNDLLEEMNEAKL